MAGGDAGSPVRATPPRSLSGVALSSQGWRVQGPRKSFFAKKFCECCGPHQQTNFVGTHIRSSDTSLCFSKGLKHNRINKHVRLVYGGGLFSLES